MRGQANVPKKSINALAATKPRRGLHRCQLDDVLWQRFDSIDIDPFAKPISRHCERRRLDGVRDSAHLLTAWAEFDELLHQRLHIFKANAVGEAYQVRVAHRDAMRTRSQSTPSQVCSN
jgi:hypothetical protein